MPPKSLKAKNRIASPPSSLRSSVAASTRGPDPAILLKIAISKLFGSSKSFGNLESLLKKEGDVCSFSNDNGSRKIIFHAKGNEGADHESLINKRILNRLSFAIPGLSFAPVGGESEEYKFNINGLDNPDVKAALQYFVNCNGEILFAAEFIASQIAENCKGNEYKDVTKSVEIEYTEPKFKGAGDVAKLPQIVVKKPKVEKRARPSQQERAVDLLLGDTGPFYEKSIKGINFALFKHKTTSPRTSSSWPDKSFNDFLDKAKSPRCTLKFNKLDQIFELFIATEQMLESYNFLPDAGEANAISLASLSTRSIKTSENIFKPEVDFWSPGLTEGDRIFWYNVLLRAHGRPLGNTYTPLVIESIEEGKVVPLQLKKTNEWRQNWLRVNMGLVAESRVIRRLPRSPSKNPNSGPKISVRRSHGYSGRSDARELNQAIRDFSKEMDSYRSRFFTRDGADGDDIKRFNEDQLAQFVYDEGILHQTFEGSEDNFKNYLMGRNNFGGSVAEINFKKKYCHGEASNFLTLSQEQIGQSVSDIKGATEKLKTIKKRCRLILEARGFSENMNVIRNRFCRPFVDDDLQLSPLDTDRVANLILEEGESLLSRDNYGYQNLVAFLDSDVDFAGSAADGNFRAKYCHGKQDADFKELTDEQIDKSTERIKSANRLFQELAVRLKLVQKTSQQRAIEEEERRVGELAAQEAAKQKRLEEERQKAAAAEAERKRLAELAVNFNANWLLKSTFKDWRRAVKEKAVAEEFIRTVKENGDSIGGKLDALNRQDQSRFDKRQRLAEQKRLEEERQKAAAAEAESKRLADLAAEQRAKELAAEEEAKRVAAEKLAQEAAAAEAERKRLEAEKLAEEEAAAAEEEAKRAAAEQEAERKRLAELAAEKSAVDFNNKKLLGRAFNKWKVAAEQRAKELAEQRAKELEEQAERKRLADLEEAKRVAEERLADDICNEIVEELITETFDEGVQKIADESLEEVARERSQKKVDSLDGIDFSKGFSKMDFVKRDVKERMEPEDAKEYFKTEAFKNEFRSADKPLINDATEVPESFYTGNDGKPRQAYYSQFVAIRFEDFDFKLLDLFMSNFRNCDFKDVDFSQIPVKSFDSINFQDCTFEGCKIPEGSKLVTDDARGIAVKQDPSKGPYKTLDVSDISKLQESQKIDWQPQPSVAIDTRRSLERIGVTGEGKAEVRRSAQPNEGDVTGPAQFKKIVDTYKKHKDIYL